MITKLAQSSGGGRRSVIVCQTVGPDGVKRLTVVGHEGGATCANSKDEEILKKLNQMNVPGYGGGGEELDGGKTNEFFEEKRKNKAKPMLANPNQPVDGMEEDEGRSRRRRIDRGIGV